MRIIVAFSITLECVVINLSLEKDARDYKCLITVYGGTSALYSKIDLFVFYSYQFASACGKSSQWFQLQKTDLAHLVITSESNVGLVIPAGERDLFQIARIKFRLK